MKELSGFPYVALRFDKKAHLLDAGPLAELKAHLGQTGTTDLIVISHGWNNDMQEAEGLYAELLGNARGLLDKGRVPGLAGRSIAVLGVLWPSKKFADKDLIPGAAAALQGTAAQEQLRAQLELLHADADNAFDAPDAGPKLGHLLELLPSIEDNTKQAKEFIDTLRQLVVLRDGDLADVPDTLFELPAGVLLERMQQPVPFVRDDGDAAHGSAAIDDEHGGAAGLGDVIGNAISGALNALNLVTYYQMKARAGLVGEQGLNPILHDIAAQLPQLRLHLVGHSFGARLVTAAAAGAGADEATLCPVASMSLLQGAFSHYGFAEKWDDQQDGFFRRVLARQAVRGPIIATCTINDRAVGLAYPLASMLAQQVGAHLGDKNDKYGGLGRNGAQKTPEAQDGALLDPATDDSYAFSAGHIHNLETRQLITDHGDVRNAAVAYAVLSAMASVQ
ncbi:hypothetical protein [uncultured Azohydromonas sp.]|jgi:hypothetical protein|uniref:hypothetical protein n=1 Tax=uncultured Azohydromonas sp. TaxID=487342 RepID=UPI002637C4C2|nr:hypothetical protein [uncultured Azohydromonas sp.]